LELYNCYYKKKNTKEEIITALRRVGLGDDIHKKLSKYSLGMAQRLSFAKVILYHPKLLLMDEPLNGLAVDGVNLFVECIRELQTKHNTAILISSHDIDIVQEICNRVIFIKKGEIQSQIDTADKRQQFVVFECDGILQYKQEIQIEFGQELQIFKNNQVGLYTDDIDKLNKFIYSKELTIKSLKTITFLRQKYIEFFGD